MSTMFDLTDNTMENAIIKVVGVGGGGCNAVLVILKASLGEPDSQRSINPATSLFDENSNPEAPFDIRKAMAIQKARAARETANQEKDIDHQKPSSPITIEETGKERDLLGRLPHPSLQGGDCFC